MSTLRNPLKLGPQRSGMTHAKWREVKSIGRKSAARYMHYASAGTYNVGRNEAKRVRRAEAAAKRAKYLKTKAEVVLLGRAFGIYN